MLRMLELVGLNHTLEEECYNLSGGEKQRLCMARVMLMEAETYLLDEPSAALDQNTEQFMIQNIVNFSKEKGRQLSIDEAYTLINREQDSFGLESAKALIQQELKNQDNFGNARGIRNLVDELKKKRDARIIAIVDQKNVSLSPEEIKTIKVEDMNQLIHAKE